MTWQRARTEEKKEVRKDAIRAAAADLFAQKGYDSISLENIAAAAGFTRPNLYRYYRSKEDLFLEIIETDLCEAQENLATTFGGIDAEQTMNGSPRGGVATAPDASSPLSPDGTNAPRITAFVERWLTLFSDHPRMLKLLPHVAMSIERNAQADRVRSFKRVVASFVDAATPFVLRWFPELDNTAVITFFNLQSALIAGTVPLARAAEVHRLVYNDADLAPFAIDLERSLPSFLVTVLTGLLQQNRL